jgi:hypothetical protein
MKVTATTQATHRTEPAEGEPHWPELMNQIGGEVGGPLWRALERVNTLATTGKIDRVGLRQLREDIERARRAGMLAQRLARLASGEISQAVERVALTQAMRDLLVQRGREISTRGIELQQSMRPAEVVVDPTLLHALLQAIVDWALDQTPGHIDVRIDRRDWSPNAFLTCQFAWPGPDFDDGLSLPERPRALNLDNLSWRLVQQIARSMHLKTSRLDDPDGSQLTVEFPQTVGDDLHAVTPDDLDQGFGVSMNSKPLAGTHVLILSARRDLRADIREAVRHMGMLLDFVNTVDEAEGFCLEAVPHAVIYESALANERFDKLRSSLIQTMPDLVFIEIAQEGTLFQLSRDSEHHQATLGRDVVLQSLPSALIFELARAP